MGFNSGFKGLNVIPTHFGVCLRHLHGACGCVLLTQACIVSEITVVTHSYGTAVHWGVCIKTCKELILLTLETWF